MTIDVDALERRAEDLDHANWGNKVTWAFVNDCLAALRQQQEALRVAKLRHEDLVGDIRALQDNAQAMAKTFRELEENLSGYCPGPTCNCVSCKASLGGKR